MEQSENHPDGWGVSYYLDGCPHVIKSTETAIEDKIFKKVSAVVRSQTVLAHLRKTTIGSNNILNTHPFQHGRWSFAHNGNIKNFETHREKLRSLVSPKLVNYILGKTDSEVLFFVFLSALESQDGPVSPSVLASRVNKTLQKVMEIIGPFNKDDSAPPSETFLTFTLTDGDVMVGFNGGKQVYFSTHKKSCSEKGGCPHFNFTCENAVSFSPKKETNINHLVISSEPIESENVWIKTEPGELFGVAENMTFFRKKIF